MAKSAQEVPRGTMSLRQKLLATAQAIGPMEQTGKNDRFKYDFFEESHVVTVVRRHLYENGVILSVDVVDVQQTKQATQSGTPMYHSRVKLNLAFMDVDSGDLINVTWFGEGTDTGDKGINKAIVAGVKYALLKNFLIPKAGDDAELEDPGHDSPPPPTRPAAAPPKQSAPAAPKASAAPAAATSSPAKGMGSSPGREATYANLRARSITPDSPTVRKYAAEALNRRVHSLYELTPDDWNAVAVYIEDNVGDGGAMVYREEGPPPDDSDIPF